MKSLSDAQRWSVKTKCFRKVLRPEQLRQVKSRLVKLFRYMLAFQASECPADKQLRRNVQKETVCNAVQEQMKCRAEPQMSGSAVAAANDQLQAV